ncbi:MarR family transcriptional regulator [Halomicrobium katesii]|uniref:MarR family transcriptional regulator n=1 Tax=Halomicrobium katesii TaxID=437163 RepID=UPI00036B85EA|nr:helix-turn-helix domain-containing protein [Halomicrobium katesii]
MPSDPGDVFRAFEDELADSPPSAKLVTKVLAHEGQLTQSQLAEETMLSKRTTRYALSELEEADVVTSEVSFMDARQSLYSTVTTDE